MTKNISRDEKGSMDNTTTLLATMTWKKLRHSDPTWNKSIDSRITTRFQILDNEKWLWSVAPEAESHLWYWYCFFQSRCVHAWCKRTGRGRNPFAKMFVSFRCETYKSNLDALGMRTMFCSRRTWLPTIRISINTPMKTQFANDEKYFSRWERLHGQHDNILGYNDMQKIGALGPHVK